MWQQPQGFGARQTWIESWLRLLWAVIFLDLSFPTFIIPMPQGGWGDQDDGTKAQRLVRGGEQLMLASSCSSKKISKFKTVG